MELIFKLDGRLLLKVRLKFFGCILNSSYFLFKASRSGHIEVVKELLDCGENIEAKIYRQKWTSLIYGDKTVSFKIYNSNIYC